MHPSILEAGLSSAGRHLAAALALLVSVASQAATCPAPTAPLREWWINADCTTCWTQSDPTTAPKGWRLDWIVPAPAAADAALAGAALPQAAERLARLHLQAPPADAARVADQASRRSAGRLKVQSGPAWNGYIGVELVWTPQRRTPVPAGAQAWLALVEDVPAGTEGSPIARTLVRNVAGPLPLDAARAGQPFSHLQALRWPDGARPERLLARGWIEAPDGRILLMAADRCAD